MHFKLRDIFALTFAFAVLFALIIPQIMRAREEPRKMQCSNNLKQLAFAADSYQSVYKPLPCAMGGTQMQLSVLAKR